MNTTEASTLGQDRARLPRVNFKLNTAPLWGAAGFLLLIAVWQVLVSTHAIAETAVPRPLAAWDALVEHRAVLATEARTTLAEILLGFCLSALLGFVIALLIHSSAVLYKLLYPQVVVAQAVPKLALVPVILIWFGFGSTSNAVIAVLISIFPMIVNTLHGFESADRNLLDLGRSMGGSKFTIFRRIKLPTAMPSIFTGMKLCMSFATVGAIAGEIFAGNAGLGFVVSSAAGSLNSALAFAGIVVISVIGLVLYYAMLWLERKLIPWAPGNLTVSA